MTTPNDINVLMHYYACPESHPRAGSVAVRGSVDLFIQDEILTSNDDNEIRVTDKGRAWIEIILRTPYPNQVWIDENGNKIDI